MVFTAAISKGAIGMGFPLISIPLASWVMDPRLAVVLISIPNTVGHFPILLRGKPPVEALKRLAPAFVVAAFGALAGAWLLSFIPVWMLSLVLAALTISYVAINLFKVHVVIRPHHERFLTPLVGLASGVLIGATGSAGIPIGIYLHSLKFPKWNFVYVQTFVFAIGNIFQVIGLFTNHLFPVSRLTFSLLLVLPALAGLFLGLRVHDRVNQQVFNRLVLIILFLSGLQLLYQGVTQGLFRP